jgi:O-antigen biosynthesis protein
LTGSFNAAPHFPLSSIALNPVDIIIPVYRGMAETRACIESVLGAQNKTPYELIVFNDASPEPEMAPYLADLARDGRITLITNARNLGFVETVNRALALDSDHDVILLNSDTEVANDWLDRMVACAARDKLIASVTPFSNNATICSYPHMDAPNAVRRGAALATLDAHFATQNAGHTVEIPTGVGFCMWMRRQVIAEIGAFDPEAFGRGYGEENDWCYQAAAAGYRHVLCADVYVAHAGEVSFAAESAERKQHAQAVIDARHPSYADDIRRHMMLDPARPYRAAIDVARLRASPLPRVVMVTHDWGGGTARHVDDLARLLADACEVLLLHPEGGGMIGVRWMRAGENFAIHFNGETEIEALVVFLRELDINRVHIHHIHHLPPAILELASKLSVPLDITLHDFFPITPLYHLLPGGVVPGANHESVANHAWGLSLAAWRAAFGKLLGRASRVISPSRNLSAQIQEFFPGLAIECWPHFILPRDKTIPTTFDIKVLVLGGMTVEKGLDVIEACVDHAARHQLPLAFVVLGHTLRPLAQWPARPLRVLGSYREDDLRRLIALERPDVFLFPSQIPESFSYTLTAAIETGKPVVAARLGAFPERLESMQRATLLAWDAPVVEWTNALLAAGHVSSPLLTDASATDPARYREQYLAPLAQSVRTPLAPTNIRFSPLATQRLYAKLVMDAGLVHERTLAELLDHGVRCGHGESFTELDRRVALADAEIARARAVIPALERNRDSLLAELERARELVASERARVEAERDAARAAFAEIISSASWRMTEPVRSAIQLARRAKARGVRGVQNTPRYAAIAWEVLRAEGPVALARRIQARLTRSRGFVAPAGKRFESESVVALVIPVYEQHLLTYTCLRSIADTTVGIAIEVIVVDDASPTAAEMALPDVTGVRFIRNQRNQGFLKNCNLAAREARGRYVAILNNDIILQPGWLASMLRVFDEQENTGLVGAKLVYPDGTLQEAGGIVWRDGSAWNVGRNDNADKPEYNYLREVDYCSGACLVMEKSFWDQLGGFDERYAPAYYEDTDLAFRVREAGKRVFYQPHATVVHFEGKSSGTDLSQGVKQHQVTNQATFLARWKDVLAAHRPNGVEPERERDRTAKQRVLVVDACMLTPDHDAGSLRMIEMLRALRELECKVTFVAENREYRQPYVADIQALGVEVLFHPFVPPIAEFLEKSGHAFDVILLSRATVACPYIATARRFAPRAKLVFDTVDLHFLREERKAELDGSATGSAAAAFTRKQELDAIGIADATLVVSPVEKALLSRLVPSATVNIVSIIHVNMPGPARFEERSGVVFIGGFRHPPNLDAITWYAEQVLPILRRKAPGIVTTIIGSNAPPTLQQYAADDFVIAGFIKDVTPTFHRARLSISPLRYGAGVKGKVNLSMQYGVPVVATTVSAEGMYLEDGVNVSIADTPEAFADAIIRLNTDESLWNTLSRGGLENIETHFSRACARKALQELLAG